MCGTTTLVRFYASSTQGAPSPWAEFKHHQYKDADGSCVSTQAAIVLRSGHWMDVPLVSVFPLARPDIHSADRWTSRPLETGPFPQP